MVKKSDKKDVAIGRPTVFKPEFCEQVEKLCRLGADDVAIANFFEVDERTIYRWKNKYPAFCQAIKDGKVFADMKVAEALYNKATGYMTQVEKVSKKSDGSMEKVTLNVNIEPDTTAAIFWLKNRHKEYWRDKTESTQNVNINMVEDASETARSRIADLIDRKRAGADSKRVH